MLLSTKNLVWQMRNRKMKKLTEKFVGLYKIKKILLENTVELELLTLMRTHPVVNVSRIALYVEKILNRRNIRGKQKYLVRWKGHTIEEKTCEGLEDLENAMEISRYMFIVYYSYNIYMMDL